MQKETVGTFSFLSKEDRELALDDGRLNNLSTSLSLSQEDSAIVRDMCDSLKEKKQLPFPLTVQEQNYLRRHDESEWVRYLIYRYKFVLYPKRRIQSEFPIYLLIEPTSVCNLRCVMCFQVDKSFTKQPFMGMMDLDLFKRVVDEAVEGGTGGITLASRGEPTLHRQLPVMLKYLSGKFFEIKLTTNATKLTESLIHDIFQSGVNLVIFSVDTHEKEIYEQIRVRGDFDIVYKNIRMFQEIREKDYPDSSLVTRISAVKFREDQDPKGFCDFWSDLVDEVGMKEAAARWDTYNNEPSPDLEAPCGYLWERLYVWYDGSISPCDADYKSMLAVGSIENSSIKDVWHGRRINEIRSDHKLGQRANCFPCDRCGISY